MSMSHRPSTMRDYEVCRVCGKQVSSWRSAWARRLWEKPICSVECGHKEMLARYACCEKAKPGRCPACFYSTECPDHGIRHHGTHD